MASGLSAKSGEAAAGLTKLNAGIAQLNGGIAQYNAGIAQADAGIAQLQAALQANPNNPQLQAQLAATQAARDKAVTDRTGLQTQLAGYTAQRDGVAQQNKS